MQGIHSWCMRKNIELLIYMVYCKFKEEKKKKKLKEV